MKYQDQKRVQFILILVGAVAILSVVALAAFAGEPEALAKQNECYSSRDTLYSLQQTAETALDNCNDPVVAASAAAKIANGDAYFDQANSKEGWGDAHFVWDEWDDAVEDYQAAISLHGSASSWYLVAILEIEGPG